MILKPKSLPDLEAKLRAVPEAQRRVIVTVGRHPNEGTIRIAQKHHAKWEKQGAVVVQIPPHWTPQGFWTAVDRRFRHFWPVEFDPPKIEKDRAISRGSAEQEDLIRKANDYLFRVSPQQDELIRKAKEIPDDGQLASFLSKNGFDVPIVNFHGISDFANVEQCFDHRVHRWLTPIPRFQVLPHSKTRLSPHELIKPNRDFPDDHYDDVLRPNAVVVEIGFDGNEATKEKQLLRNKLLVLQNHFPPNSVSPQLDLDYLVHPAASPDVLNQYAKHKGDFEELLRHLAQTGLRKS